MSRVVITICIEPELKEAVEALKRVGFNVSAVCNDSLWAAVEAYGPDSRLSEAGKVAVGRAVEICRKRREEAERERAEEEKRRAEAEAKKSKSYGRFLEIVRERSEWVMGRLNSGEAVREEFLKHWMENTGKTREELLELAYHHSKEAEKKKKEAFLEKLLRLAKEDPVGEIDEALRGPNREKQLKTWADKTGKTVDELLDLVCGKRGKRREELLATDET